MENNSALALLSNKLAVNESEMKSIVMRTIMPNGGKGVTEEQFLSFISVANEYGLNPLTKQIYAFPTRGGGIQPIVSIDGWLKIINTHPLFNGMVFSDARDSEKLISITCKIFKKGIEHPVEVTEYLEECYQGNKDPWKKWPARMLRHKAAIQAGRYAFGLSGIIDPDEAERYEQEDVIDMGKIEPEQKHYSQEKFDKNLPAWADLIESGKRTAEQIILTVGSNANLNAEQKKIILELKGS